MNVDLAGRDDRDAMNLRRSPLKSEGALLAQQQWRRKLQAAFLQRSKSSRLSCVRRLRQSPSYQAGSELYSMGFTAEEIDAMLADDDDLIDELQLYEASCEPNIDDSLDISQTHVLCPICQRDQVRDLGQVFTCPCGFLLSKSGPISDLDQLRLFLSAMLESHPRPCRPRFRSDRGQLVLACDRCQVVTNGS